MEPHPAPSANPQCAPAAQSPKIHVESQKGGPLRGPDWLGGGCLGCRAGSAKRRTPAIGPRCRPPRRGGTRPADGPLGTRNANRAKDRVAPLSQSQAESIEKSDRDFLAASSHSGYADA